MAMYILIYVTTVMMANVADISISLCDFRAKFSEITAQSVQRALRTLAEPNRNISNAVDVRQELDLRIGKAICVAHPSNTVSVLFR
jgi:DNA topoisomerase IA